MRHPENSLRKSSATGFNQPDGKETRSGNLEKVFDSVPLLRSLGKPSTVLKSPLQWMWDAGAIKEVDITLALPDNGDIPPQIFEGRNVSSSQTETASKSSGNGATRNLST